MPTEFTPIASLVGGALIGLASVLLMATHGRIAGISGIAARMFPPYVDGSAIGRVAFVLGLVAAPSAYFAVTGNWPSATMGANVTVIILGGLLAGFGSVWSNGCTSGHGICGLARLSARSLAAVLCFMATAVITVFIVRHLL